MEAAVAVSSRRVAVRSTRLFRALWVAFGVAVLPGPGTTAENSAVELAGALGRLGPPGVLWGRLAVEEESPDGPWTPLNGVEVQAYPAVPAVLADLERIRQSARDSGRQHETAVARLRAALAAHQAQVEAMSPGASGRRRVTDSSGIFVFEDLPSGEWLLVAIRVTPYGAATGRSEPRSRAAVGEQRFLPKPGEASREAEVWLTRVRVGPGERVPLLLTDRARWLVGPLR